MRTRTPLALGAALVAVMAVAPPASATHAWGGYHWAQNGTAPVVVALGNNLTGPSWAGLLDVVAVGAATVDDGWDDSVVLDTPVALSSVNPKNCRPTSGRVEVCNATYGKTGWLGIAQIWTSGGHIVQGTAKQNDTYFSTARYNTPQWRQFVLCQEVGHTFGLGHNDEIFDNANKGTCMDYTSNPAGGAGNLANLTPNAHDFDQLRILYNGHHAAPVAAAAPLSANAVGNSASSWGRLLLGADRQTTSLFVREQADSDAKVFTFVIWAS